MQQRCLSGVTVSDAGRLASALQKADNLHHIFGSKSSGARECDGLCVAWPFTKSDHACPVGVPWLTWCQVVNAIGRPNESAQVTQLDSDFFPPVVLSSFFQSRAFWFLSLQQSPSRSWVS